MSEELNQAHRDMVGAKFKSGDDLFDEMTPHKLMMNHAIIGIASEAGEIADAVKKITLYAKDRKPDFNRDAWLTHVKEELGDMEFFLEALRQQLGISREDTLSANITKLDARYASGKFSNEEAETRADKTETTSDVVQNEATNQAVPGVVVNNSSAGLQEPDPTIMRALVGEHEDFRSNLPKPVARAR